MKINTITTKIAITAKIPMYKPALKIPSMAAQLLKKNSIHAKEGKINFFMFDEIKKREDEFLPVLKVNKLDALNYFALAKRSATAFQLTTLKNAAI